MKRNINLIQALKDNNLINIKEILRTSSPNVQEYDKSALMLAIELNNLDAIELLLESKLIKVNAQNQQGITALHLAVQKNNPLICAMLIKKQADYYICDHDQKQPFDYLSTDISIHQPLKTQNRDFIRDIFYHGGFRKSDLEEKVLVMHGDYKLKVHEKYSQNFIEKAKKMNTLYHRNTSEYFKERNKYLNHTIIKYLSIIKHTKYAKNILKYLKPNVNFFLNKEHILLKLLQNENANLLQAIKETNTTFNFSLENKNKKNIIHNILDVDNYSFVKQLNNKDILNFLIDNLKKNNALEQVDENGMVPFFYLNAFDNQNNFDFVFKIISETNLFDIHKKFKTKGVYDQPISFIEVIEKLNNDYNCQKKYASFSNFYEKVKAFDEKKRLDDLIQINNTNKNKVKI